MADFEQRTGKQDFSFLSLCKTQWQEITFGRMATIVIGVTADLDYGRQNMRQECILRGRRGGRKDTTGNSQMEGNQH